MGITDEKLDLFEPQAAALALRDTPYNSTAHALAEIVDNSIDAHARHIDILIMTKRESTPAGQSVSVVRGLAVIDNGNGMNREILAKSLVVGGRSEETIRNQKQIGKYGVGLPTSSLSQCRRVDVWSWQNGLDSAWHCHLDVDEIKDGKTRVPAPVQESVPDFWSKQSRSNISNSESGTLVVWSKLDRADWRTSRTTMNRVEEEVGRIYRDFIQTGEVSLVMSVFNSNGDAQTSQPVKSNDPLYLMDDTVYPQHKPGEPMFYKWGKKSIPVPVNGAQHIVEIIFSRVKEDVLLEEGTRAAGATEHGRKAARNIGISVMREGRELMTLPPLQNLGDPRHRWWGCELQFNRNCDELFGVDHSKQLAARLQAVHKSIQRGDTSEEQIFSENDRNTFLYRIVNIIKGNTGSMFNEIRRIRSNSQAQKSGESGPDFSGGAGEQATRDIVTAISRGQTEATATEKERNSLTDEFVRDEVEKDLISDGLEPGMAKSIASWAASNKVDYVINPGRVSGSSLFDIRNDHGVIRIILNQEHRLYPLLDVLSDHNVQEDDFADEKKPRDVFWVLYLLLCAWARMVEQTPNTQARQQLENTVMRWGNEANLMLATMTNRLIGEEE